MNTKLTEEESKRLNYLIYEYSFYDIADYINSLLLDRYNKGKEEGIEHEQDRIYSEISNTSIKDIRGDFVDIIDIVDKRILKSIIYNLTPNQ